MFHGLCLLSVMMAAVMIVGFTPVFGVTQNPYLAVNPALRVFDQYHIWIGVTFDMNVTVRQLDAGWNLFNITTYLTCNSTLLLVENVVFNNLWNTTSWSMPSAEDLRLDASSPSAAPSGDILLATVTFRVRYQGGVPPDPFGHHDDSPLILHNYELSDPTGVSIPTDPAVNGLVQIYSISGGWPDIAVTSFTFPKTAVGQNYLMSFNVTVSNYEIASLTFNVTVYANTTVIGFFQNVTAPADSSAVINVDWNTLGFSKGNYSITAFASPVQYEQYTANNNLTSGPIQVTIPGDITGPDGRPDGKVDMRDIGYIARHFGIPSISPLWDPRTDINGDGKADMVDIGIAARHFGETDH